jgi:hypothetical protein
VPISVVGSQLTDDAETLLSLSFLQPVAQKLTEGEPKVREGSPENTGIASLDAIQEHRVNGFEKAAGRSAESRQDAEVFAGTGNRRRHRRKDQQAAEPDRRSADGWRLGQRSAGSRPARLRRPRCRGSRANYVFQTQLTPNDPYWVSIHQQVRQHLSMGTAGLAGRPGTHRGDPSIVIAVVDTGVDADILTSGTDLRTA